MCPSTGPRTKSFFYRAAWKPEDASRLMLQRVVDPLLKNTPDRTMGPLIC